VFGFGEAKRRRRALDAIHDALLERALDPALFRAGVPDTLEGRFEAVALHAVLVLRRLREGEERDAALAQDLVDRIFHGFDRALRATGVADLRVPKRVSALAADFYGRAEAYERALAPDAEPDALARALARNLFGRDEPSPTAQALADHVRRAEASLRAAPVADIARARLAIPPLSLAVEETA
jgi:cytochrome b pre-mRNA-processing protein 3